MGMGFPLVIRMLDYMQHQVMQATRRLTVIGLRMTANVRRYPGHLGAQMKSNSIKLLLIVSFAVVLGISSRSFGDAGVFTGNGQDLHQITSKTVQLVSIDVTIILGRGPFLFDGSVPGMDLAEYQCTFLLRNLSDKDEEIKVGFPVDSEFARGSKPDSPSESRDWVLEYGFIALDQKTTYHVEFVRRKPQSGPGEFGSVFVWNMRFSPKETKSLTVQYRIPMSMGLVPMEKDEKAAPGPGVFGQEFLNIGSLDMAGYITSTGSSWAGNVESAKFTLITEPFEKYFKRRGIGEESDVEMDREAAEQFNSSFPVRHPWWFRRIEPQGWKPIEGGVQWQYKDYKPKDSISVSYYTTPFPQSPEEVDALVDRFLKGLGPGESAATQLGRLKQVILATYGNEPEDGAAKSFASRQLWYEPRKDFSLDHLNASQRAVLEKIDRRIATAGAK
jgi:hypothetical protein